MKILIACALEGRDLALVRSLLNIQKDYAGVTFQFTGDTREGQVLIVKDYHDQGAAYYALNRQNGNKTPILPNLNPKSLKNLFNAIAQKLEGGSQRIENFDQFKPFENTLFDFMHASSQRCLSVQQGNETLCFDKAENRVASSAELSTQVEVLKSIQKDQRLKTHGGASEVDVALPHTMPLDLFCWNLGSSIDSKILTEHVFENPKYKLISWPNYGEFACQQEFIYLSSLIWKSAETMSQILERTGFEQPVVCQFLNAGLLTGHVTVFNNDNSATSQPKARKISGFLSGVKKVFGF